jgi:hypothetical protein
VSHVWAGSGWAPCNDQHLHYAKAEASPGLFGVIRTIDKFTEWTDYLFVLLIIPLIVSNVIEVFCSLRSEGTDDLGPR